MALVNQVRNPSFEYGVTAGVATTGYNLSGTAATVTQQVDGAAPSGTHVAQVVVTGGNQGFAELLAGTYASTDKISVFIALKGSAGSEVVTLLLSDAGGTTYASVGSPATLTTTWTGYYLDVSASSNNWQGGAFSGKTIGLVVRSGPSSGAATFFVDAAMANVNVALGSYFDGDNGGTWNGTPGDSASTETAAGAALAGAAVIVTSATGGLASSALQGAAVIVTTASGGLVQPPRRFTSQPATAQPSLMQPATIAPMIALTGGAAAIVTAASGSARTAAVLAGAAAVTTTATGIVIARPVLSGSAALTTTATVSATTPAVLSGASAITTTASGTLVAPSILLGASAIQTSGSGALNAASILAGTAAIITTALAAIAAPPSYSMSGFAALATTATGVTGTPAVLAGTAAIQTTASGAPTAQLAASTTVTTTATGALTATTLLSSTATITTTATGVLAAQLSGAAQITTSSTASFTTTGALQGQADLSTTATGSLPNVAALYGSADYVTNTTGLLSVPTLLTGTASTQTTATALLTTALTPGYIIATDVLSGDGVQRDAYEPDNYITLTARVYRIGGLPQDPQSLTLEVLNPTQAITTYTTTDMTHTAPGVYSIMILVSTAGQWEYEFSTTGPTADTGDQAFNVLPSLL